MLKTSALRKRNCILRKQFDMCYRPRSSKSSTPKIERSTVPVFDLESYHLKRIPAIFLNRNYTSQIAHVVQC